ncbi:hypothetical protein SAMN05216302_10733 [Nitrosomonas aestuarii]|uniref:Uncharacterized protein n=1 Tax=Nitrosomonas aestuarii TaxID=52441 RepID=A0A1I4H7D1_9PROT|nr:hypothetical protein SAMN05216302_10733 [Nitrosomonas aestuarii]
MLNLLFRADHGTCCERTFTIGKRMTFSVSTEAMSIITSSGDAFNMLLSRQHNNLWVATVIYEINDSIYHESIYESDKEEAYRTACNFVKDNIDDNAIIKPV